MKVLLIIVAMLLNFCFAQATDYGDKNCNIFVVNASNIITGGYGNFITATVAVSKDLIKNYYQKYQVKILDYEEAEPSEVAEIGNFKVFTFHRYRRGIEYKGNTARVETFITNGIDRLFDNNDNVWLIAAHNWQYTNLFCKLQ